MHGRCAGRYAVRIRYPSPSTLRAVQQDDTPIRCDGSLGDDTPGPRSFAPFAHAKGCAHGRAVLRSSDGCCFCAPPPSPYFDGHRRESRLRRSIDRLSSSRGRLKEDAMRSIVLGAIVAAGLSLVSAVPTVSAPANVAVIGQAAADIGTVSQVRCWCTWRGWRGYCRRWRCW